MLLLLVGGGAAVGGALDALLLRGGGALDQLGALAGVRLPVQDGLVVQELGALQDNVSMSVCHMMNPPTLTCPLTISFLNDSCCSSSR